jgi:hypothetical protein
MFLASFECGQSGFLKVYGCSVQWVGAKNIFSQRGIIRTLTDSTRNGTTVHTH